jgi:outer membrane protein assembly factor BamB
VTLDSNNDLITLSLAKGEATTTIKAPGKAQFLNLLAATSATAYIFGVADNTASNDTYVLWAIDLPTGNVRWHQSDGNKGINIGTTLTVAGGKLLCTDALYNVTARNPATGAVQWNVNVGRLKDSVDPQPFLAASPGLGIAIAARQELTGRDLATGATKWLVPAIAARDFFTKPVMSADGTTCYVVVQSNPGAVLAIDAANGDKKWDAGYDFPGNNPPALADGLLFASIAPGGTTGMYAFDGASGKNLWSFTDATATGNEWMLAAVPSSGTVVALHDSALLALPAVR